MKLSRISTFLILTLFVLIPATRLVNAQSGPASVLVYYYAWWSPEAVGPGKSPDWPVNPYHSWDSAVIQQHVAQAASAGIDGLLVAWYGPEETNNQTETNFRVILDQAQANGIKALLSVDLASAAWFKNTQEIIEGLNYALTVHAQHPAYFRYNGKPVLFFWFQGRYSLADWAAIRQEVDPNHNSIWIAEGAALDALPTFDGLHLYTISWSQNVAGTEATWSSSTRSRGGLWVGTAMPGWDNTYTQQSERYIRERQEGAFYRETFAAAAASSPSMIVITSWNEWWEGTHIEPSTNYGDFYLHLTAQLIGEYKASGAVAGGGGSAPPVQATNAPAIAAEPATPIPEGIDSEQGVSPSTGTLSPALKSTAAPTSLPTSTLPPTITPTVIMMATIPQQQAPSTPLPEIANALSGTEIPEQTNETGALMRRLMNDPTGRWVAGGSIVAGIVGLGMVISALTAYLHGRGTPRR